MKFATTAVVILGLATVACGHKSEPAEGRQATVTSRMGKSELVIVPKLVELYGTVEAERQAAVSSRVMATVIGVRVKAGDAVKAGQVLLEIDPQTARGQEAQARGALAQAHAALALAVRNFERFKALAAKGAAAELELDMARMQYEQAKGAVEQAQGAVDAAASVARESQVVAPFAGRVTAKLVEVGDLAAPGRPLVMVEAATGRRLALSVPESVFTAASLRVGMAVPVRIDALGETSALSGTVEEMTPGADPANHAFLVKVRLEGREVPAGLAGRAWVTVGSRSVVAVPSSAVVTSGGVPMIAVRDAAGLARTRAVVTGERLPDGRIEVLSGLAGGEDVLLEPGAMPPDGAPVQEARQ
jgi:multidrug efflux system membrane fusion protein